MPASDVTVTAVFAEIAVTPTYTITVTETTNGEVATDLTEAEAGQTVVLTVEPDEGYELDALTVKDEDGSTVKLTSPSTFSMPASDVTVTATFKKTTYAVVTSATGNGEVTADMDTAAEGDTVMLTVSPKSGYQLAGLTVLGVDGTFVTISDNTFKMPEQDVLVISTFEESGPYDITVIARGNGTVTASTYSARAGETVSLTAIPGSDLYLPAKNVSEDHDEDVYEYEVAAIAAYAETAGDIPVDRTQNSFSFVMPDEDVTVEFYFALSDSEITEDMKFAVLRIDGEDNENSGTYEYNENTATLMVTEIHGLIVEAFYNAETDSGASKGNLILSDSFVMLNGTEINTLTAEEGNDFSLVYTCGNSLNKLSEVILQDSAYLVFGGTGCMYCEEISWDEDNDSPEIWVDSGALYVDKINDEIAYTIPYVEVDASDLRPLIYVAYSLEEYSDYSYCLGTGLLLIPFENSESGSSSDNDSMVYTPMAIDSNGNVYRYCDIIFCGQAAFYYDVALSAELSLGYAWNVYDLWENRTESYGSVFVSNGTSIITPSKGKFTFTDMVFVPDGVRFAYTIPPSYE